MFKCDICENTFTRERNMRRHKKNIHQKASRVRCNKCNKTFTRPDSLRAHQKVCCKCRLCNKQFETLNLLSNHNRFINVSKEAPPTQKLKGHPVAANHVSLYLIISLFVT